MKRVITITSGKGGVGKTNISVNLAVQLAKKGIRTCIFDADLGLANINILLGISPEYNLEDVITGEKNLTDILVRDPCGIDIIPGGTGVEKLTGMPFESLTRLIETFSCLEDYDILFFDTSAGISLDVISFCMASREVVLVVIPEPTSLTDGYSLLKVLSLNGYRDPVKVVINQAKNERLAQAVFNKFNETVRKYLPLDIAYMGCLPADETVAEAVARQRPFVTLYPSGRATIGIARLVRNLLDHPGSDVWGSAFETFWRKYADFAKSPLKLPQKKTKGKTDRPASGSPSEERQKTDSPAPAGPAAADNSLSHQILDSLNRLVTVTTDISLELKEFRRALGKQVSSDSAPAIPEDGAQTSQLPPIIALDFEAYVEKRKQTKTR
jgi:flagellar biosynthesis protein FlhG